MSSQDEDSINQFGVSRKIMIAAILSLLGVVLLIVSLHFYSRYLLKREARRRRRATINRLSRQIAPFVADSDGSTREVGLTPLVIASFPTFLYNQTVQHGEGEQVECSVCLVSIGEEEMVRILPNCNHMFHVECVDMWLGSHTTCPLCRTEAEPKVQQQSQDLENKVQHSASALEENSGANGAQSEKVSGSGSRLGSFRILVTRERSSRTRSCGDEVRVEDLERQ